MQLSNVVKPIDTFEKEAGFYTGKAERAKSKVKGKKENNGCENQNMFG